MRSELGLSVENALIVVPLRFLVLRGLARFFPECRNTAILCPDRASLAQADLALATQSCVHPIREYCADFAESSSQPDLLHYQPLR
jgi:hypothetical protein